MRAGNEKLVGLFADFLKHGKNLNMAAISAEIAEAAGRLRARHPTPKAFDAMQIAVALNVKAELFVTNDKKLKNVEEIRVLVLEDHAVHSLDTDAQDH